MNVFSQSASRGETDSGDDSELSLSIIEKVQSEPFSFDHGQDRKYYTKVLIRKYYKSSRMIQSNETEF